MSITSQARAAINEIDEALLSIAEELETATEDVDQQIEDGELDRADRDSAIREVMGGIDEALAIIRGQAQDLQDAIG